MPSKCVSEHRTNYVLLTSSGEMMDASVSVSMDVVSEMEFDDLCNMMQMSFNPTQCVGLRISNKKKTACQTHYQFHDHTLEVVDASKYLGVMLTEDLSLDKQ